MINESVDLFGRTVSSHPNSINIDESRNLDLFARNTIIDSTHLPEPKLIELNQVTIFDFKCEIHGESLKLTLSEVSAVAPFIYEAILTLDGIINNVSEMFKSCGNIEEVKGQSVLFGDEINRDVAIVYSPLNGTGLVPVTKVLNDIGITDITIVPEQEYPNGYFTTCSYPNPEIYEALEYGLKLAEKTGADLMLATDPDADRVGIAMKCPDGSYELVSGNEMGVLLLDYICAGRIEKGTMPKNPVAVMSIVSTPLADKVACPTAADPSVLMVFRSFMAIEPAVRHVIV